MELKDVILSTLAEMEDTPAPISNSDREKKDKTFQENREVLKEEVEIPSVTQDDEICEPTYSTTDNELLYLTSIRERLLVLFEGFQAPNNTNLEAKVDMTLNFLEYTLSTIDARVETINKRKKQ
jgi:hypothetical protein